jgi:hypothetical protein
LVVLLFEMAKMPAGAADASASLRLSGDEAVQPPARLRASALAAYPPRRWCGCSLKFGHKW